jgi:hypothetical protein
LHSKIVDKKDKADKGRVGSMLNATGYYDRSQITEEPHEAKVLTHGFEDESFQQRNGLVYSLL